MTLKPLLCSLWHGVGEFASWKGSLTTVATSTFTTVLVCLAFVPKKQKRNQLPPSRLNDADPSSKKGPRGSQWKCLHQIMPWCQMKHHQLKLTTLQFHCVCVCVCAHWTAMSTSFFCWHYQTHSDKKKYSVATLRIEEKKNGSIGQVSVCLPDCAMFTVDIKIPPIDQRFFFWTSLIVANGHTTEAHRKTGTLAATGRSITTDRRSRLMDKRWWGQSLV